MENNNVIVVTFKETYMSKPVTRCCIGMTQPEVIKTYGLDRSDIEWYRFKE